MMWWNGLIIGPPGQMFSRLPDRRDQSGFYASGRLHPLGQAFRSANLHAEAVEPVIARRPMPASLKMPAPQCRLSFECFSYTTPEAQNVWQHFTASFCFCAGDTRVRIRAPKRLVYRRRPRGVDKQAHPLNTVNYSGFTQ